MTEALDRKLEALKGALTEHGRLAVAFSGGVDSAFLLLVAQEVLGDGVLAVTASSPLMSQGELDGARRFCEARGIRLAVANVNQLACEEVRLNRRDRCYACKGMILDAIIEVAESEGIPYVADGSNVDDLCVHRPGRKALQERGVASPLADAGLTKAEIRSLLRERGEEIWWKPSNACLATRLEYDVELTPSVLKRIDDAESALRQMGFEQVRVRVHGPLARIEVSPGEIARIADVGTRLEIIQQLKELGFVHVCVDLQGFRSGSMDAR